MLADIALTTPATDLKVDSFGTGSCRKGSGCADNQMRGLPLHRTASYVQTNSYKVGVFQLNIRKCWRY